MYLNLDDPKTLLLTGSITSLGGFAILVENYNFKKLVCEFLVAMEVTDPSALWKKLGLSVSDHFNFLYATVYF